MIDLGDIRQGDTYPIRVQYEPGTDLAGARHTFMLKRAVTDPDSSAVLSVESMAGDHPGDDLAAGVIYLVVNHVATGAVSPGYYYGVIVSELANGDHETILSQNNDGSPKILRVLPCVGHLS